MSGEKYTIVFVVFLTMLAGLFLGSVNFNPEGDNSLSLLVSKTLIEKRSFKLDCYYDGTCSDGHHFRQDYYGLARINGHFYEFYPPGTAIFSVPAVLLTKIFGVDIIEFNNRRIVSILIATMLNLLIFSGIFLIGRHFISETASFVITAVSFLGSSLTSTLGASLTSHHYVVLFSVLVVLLLLREESGKGNVLTPYVIGVLLFSSFLTRPASACFIVTTLGYLFFKDRKYFLKTAVVSFLLLMCFVAFSFFELGSPLPPYYQLSSTYVDSGVSYAGGRDDGFLAGLYGILLSPSRGLFVFSPFLLVIAAGAGYSFSHLKKDGFFWFGVGWFLTNILLISNWFSWEGGHSFGPRLLTDSFPALILISFLLWSRIEKAAKGGRFKLAIASYAVLGMFAIWVNSYQGLYNEWVVWWNKVPPLGDNVDKFVFDWRYPQFLADGDRIKKRIEDYCGKKLVLCDDSMRKKKIALSWTEKEGFFYRVK